MRIHRSPALAIPLFTACLMSLGCAAEATSSDEPRPAARRAVEAPVPDGSSDDEEPLTASNFETAPEVVASQRVMDDVLERMNAPALVVAETVDDPCSNSDYGEQKRYLYVDEKDAVRALAFVSKTPGEPWDFTVGETFYYDGQGTLRVASSVKDHTMGCDRSEVRQYFDEDGKLLIAVTRRISGDRLTDAECRSGLEKAPAKKVEPPPLRPLVATDPRAAITRSPAICPTAG